MSRQPPGWRRPAEMNRQVETAQRVQGNVSAGALAKQEKNLHAPPKSVDHVHEFRDGKDVLRKPNGQFKKDTVPKHKRATRTKPK